MTRIMIVAAIIATVVCAPIARAQVKASAVAYDQSEAVVKVISLDRNKRIAVVQTPTGAELTINIPPEAQNLDRVKAGDLFKMRYFETVAISLSKGGVAGASEVQTVQAAAKGDTPGGRVLNTKRVAVSVQAIDRGSRTLAVQGPDKKVFSLKVAPEVRSFDDIAVGDTIGVTYTEALALEMVPQSGAPAKAGK